MLYALRNTSTGELVIIESDSLENALDSVNTPEVKFEVRSPLQEGI